MKDKHANRPARQTYCAHPEQRSIDRSIPRVRKEKNKTLLGAGAGGSSSSSSSCRRGAATAYPHVGDRIRLRTAEHNSLLPLSHHSRSSLVEGGGEAMESYLRCTAYVISSSGIKVTTAFHLYRIKLFIKSSSSLIKQKPRRPIPRYVVTKQEARFYISSPPPCVNVRVRSACVCECCVRVDHSRPPPPGTRLAQIYAHPRALKQQRT